MYVPYLCTQDKLNQFGENVFKCTQILSKSMIRIWTNYSWTGLPKSLGSTSLYDNVSTRGDFQATLDTTSLIKAKNPRYGNLCQAVLWIRIQLVPGSGIKEDKTRKKLIYFIFWSARCSIWKNFVCIFLIFWSSTPWIRIRNWVRTHLKLRIWIRIRIRIQCHNTDVKHYTGTCKILAFTNRF